MALVDLRGIEISFGHPRLLAGVDFRIEPKERVCVVGRNGSGKTTLMRLILGEITPDAGRIDRAAGMRMAGLPQVVPGDLAGTCRDVVSNGLDHLPNPVGVTSHEVDAVLSRLGLDPDQEVSQMSGGMKRRTLLARALAAGPDLLLLDEPTNHLDIQSIEWLEQFLDRTAGTLLFVTHDRVFLKKLASRIVDLENGRLTSWACDYETYLEKKRAALEEEEARNKRFDKKLAKEEIWIRQGIKARRTRNEGRVRALEKMREEARQRRAHQGTVRMHAQKTGRVSKKVAQVKTVSFGYRLDRLLIRELTTTVYRGDKIGIIGPNGCGKTTLLRLVLGEIEPTRGEVEQGENLRISYLDQLRMALDHSKTVIENVIESGDKVFVDGKPKHIVSYLQDFLFTPERAQTPVRVLSGGERNRLVLARLFTVPSNVLVLDEPTNDLDIETLELLEELLLAYKGTLLLVSHDRAFLNNTVTSTLVFERDGQVVEYAGGYDDWLTQKKTDEPSERKDRAKSKPLREKPRGPRKLTFKEKAELEALPGRIDDLEKEQAQIHAALADPQLYRERGAEVGESKIRLEQIESELRDAYDRWQELEAIQEAFQVARQAKKP